MQQQEDPIDQTKIKIKEGIEFALELIKKLSKSLAEQQREHYEVIKSLQINISITQIIEQDHQQAADIYNKTFDKDFWQNASEEEAFNCYATSCVWSHYSSEASTAKTHIESHIEERLLHLRGYYDQDPQAQQQSAPATQQAPSNQKTNPWLQQAGANKPTQFTQTTTTTTTTSVTVTELSVWRDPVAKGQQAAAKIQAGADPNLVKANQVGYAALNYPPNQMVKPAKATASPTRPAIEGPKPTKNRSL